LDVAASTEAWVRELATSPLVGTRRRLAREVAACIEPSRPDWLEMLSDDLDPVVSRIVSDAIRGTNTGIGSAFSHAVATEFLRGVRPRGFSWEWEYVVSIWLPGCGPTDRLVFRATRNDGTARSDAFLAAAEAAPSECTRGAAFITSRRLVCEHTRATSRRLGGPFVSRGDGSSNLDPPG